MTIENRLKEKQECLEKQKSWKKRFDALDITLEDFCKKSKKLKNYGKGNLSRVINLKMEAKPPTVAAIEKVLATLEKPKKPKKPNGK